MKFYIKRPQECSELEIDEFIQLILDGGQVDTRFLMNRIKNAKFLAFCYVNEELVSISSIKVPDIGYKNRIFRSSAIETEANLHSFEIGYSVTQEKHRGNGYNFKLNRELLTKLEKCKIYATTANSGMIRLLKKLDFKSIGVKYKGKHNDELQLYSLYIT